jgi:hypothetical protein
VAAELVHAARDRRERRLGRMAGHRPGVAEAEVDDLVAVDVDDAVAVRPLEEDRVAADPHLHPLHRHAADQVAARFGEALARPRGALGEQRALAREDAAEERAVDRDAVGGGHRALLGSHPER